MEEQAAAVAADAEVADERLALIQGLQGQGFAAGFRGRFRHAETPNRRGNAIARAEGKLYRFTVGVTNLSAVVLAPQGRCDEARVAVAEAKALYPDWRDSILPEWEIAVHWFAGDMRTALARAVDVAGRDAGELSKRRAFGIAFAILAACDAGDGAAARAHLGRVQRAFGSRDWQFFPRACMHARGVLEWYEGRPSDACATLAEAGKWLQFHGALPYAALALLDLAEAAADCGFVEMAADAAQRLGDVAGDIDSPIYPALAALAAARRDLGTGTRPDLAAIRDAIDVLSRTDCRGFGARAYDVLGRSLVAHELPGAVDALSRAAAAFDTGGASWRRDRVRTALRALGTEGRKAVVAQMGPAALTRREREIARLAANGLTAAAIASRLSISERTVETHLANVYTKLGVRSKMELIRRAAEFTLNT
jgi:DNA-binding CsgD family transcriptional regulator